MEAWVPGDYGTTLDHESVVGGLDEVVVDWAVDLVLLQDFVLVYDADYPGRFLNLDAAFLF